MKNKKIVFFGTTHFAKELLEELILQEYNVIAVVAQPDKKLDRKKQIIFSPVKSFALSKNINIFQPEKVSSITNELKELNPNLIITCAYGQFVNQEILNICPSYNFHASLLPKLRGGAPIHWSIINGFKETGMSIISMTKKMDAGQIWYQESVEINNKDTFDSLEKKLISLSRKIIRNNLEDILSQNCFAKEQNENEVTFGLNISKQDEKIIWNNDVEVVYNKIRGLNSTPGAYTMYQGKRLKIYDCDFERSRHNEKPGIIKIDNSRLIIYALDGLISINVLQIEGKGKVQVSEILKGTTFKTNNFVE